MAAACRPFYLRHGWALDHSPVRGTLRKGTASCRAAINEGRKIDSTIRQYLSTVQIRGSGKREARYGFMEAAHTHQGLFPLTPLTIYQVKETSAFHDDEGEVTIASHPVDSIESVHQCINPGRALKSILACWTSSSKGTQLHRVDTLCKPNGPHLASPRRECLFPPRVRSGTSR